MRMTKNDLSTLTAFIFPLKVSTAKASSYSGGNSNNVRALTSSILCWEISLIGV